MTGTPAAVPGPLSFLTVLDESPVALQGRGISVRRTERRDGQSEMILKAPISSRHLGIGSTPR